MTAQINTTSQTRILTWILFLCFIHTIPVPWYLIVGAGIAPAIVLFLVGFKQLLFISGEGLLFLIFFLIPALIYFLIFYLLAKLGRRIICRIPNELQQLFALVVVAISLLVISLDIPIYVSGGHGASTYSNAHEIFDVFEIFDKQSSLLKYYYFALTALFACLFLVFLSPDLYAIIGRAVGPIFNNRFSKKLLIALVVVGFIFTNRVLFLYKPLAEINISWAQINIGDQLQTHKKNQLLGNQDPAYWYKRAADNGNIEAIMIMSQRSNLMDRIYWLEIAAEKNHGEAQYTLHQYLLRQKYEVYDIDRAYNLLEKSAANDYAAAQYELATLYASDHGSKPANYKKDLKKSRHWYERAAGNEHIKAIQTVASHYEKGEGGFPVDKKRAREMYQTLAKHFEQYPDKHVFPGQDMAVEYDNRAKAIDTSNDQLDELNPVELKKNALELLQASGASIANRQQGLSYLQQAAEQDDADAAYQLGEIYSRGRYGIGKDLQKARNWWEQASDGGQRNAMERIANGTLNGSYGYQTDLLKARKQVERLVEAYEPLFESNAEAERKYYYWKQHIAYIDNQMKRVDGAYQSPAKMNKQVISNDIEATFSLGKQLLETGSHNEKQRGIKLLTKAADSGHIEACYLMVSLYSTTNRIFERNPDKGRSYLFKAAEAKHPRAMSQLAFAYEKGRYGIKQDRFKALKLFQETVAILELQQNDSIDEKRFLGLNKGRINVAKRMLGSQNKWQNEYKNANDNERTVMDIRKKYRKLYAQQVNAICKNKSSCTPAYRRQESERIRIQTDFERDVEISSLKSKTL